MFQIIDPVEYEEKIQKSRFICHLIRIRDWQEAKAFIGEINEQHKNATHNCWAYVVGKKGELVHCSDAGEPAGTAGKPMLNALVSHNLSNTVAVVTRYFGGVKLGVRGLIEAYGGVTERAIASAQLSEIIDYFYYEVFLGYEMLETLKYKLRIPGLEIIDIQYTEKIELVIQIREDIQDQTESILYDLQNNRKIEFNRKSA